MSSYDFVTRLDRRNAGSLKWNDAVDKAGGTLADGIVPLSVADMEFVAPPEIRTALTSYLDGAVLGYAGPTQEFYDAVIGWQQRRHHWNPKQEWISVSPGIVAAIYNAVRCFTKPGDAVIVQQPVYYPFSAAVKDSGRNIAVNPLIHAEDGSYKMDFDNLEQLASRDDVSMLILCSPHNPVGRVWTDKELRKLIDICIAHEVFIVADEIHNDLVMPGYEHHTLMNLMTPTEYDYCMVCVAPSKTFNLAGCQCSCIYLPNEEKRTRFDQGLREVGVGLLNSFAFPATIAAYTQLEDWLDELIELIWNNWQLCRSIIETAHPQALSSPLEGTYLQWVDLGFLGLNNEELEQLMRKHGLYLDEGHIFGAGGSGFERINLAAPREVIQEAARRFVAACDEICA
ncbi:MAG: pyridoxal phosphate-dependent aminotransferase [Atopobiaceae bacterium]|nr:pyridoxal phosphate-dependent aminotransferase [Atopobiaceae bacterium]